VLSPHSYWGRLSGSCVPRGGGKGTGNMHTMDRLLYFYPAKSKIDQKVNYLVEEKFGSNRGNTVALQKHTTVQIGKIMRHFIMLLISVILVGCQSHESPSMTMVFHELSCHQLLVIRDRNRFVTDLVSSFRERGFVINYNSKEHHFFLAISSDKLKGFIDVDFSNYADYPSPSDFQPANVSIRSEFEPRIRCQYLGFEKEVNNVADIIVRCAGKDKDK